MWERGLSFEKANSKRQTVNSKPICPVDESSVELADF